MSEAMPAAVINSHLAHLDAPYKIAIYGFYSSLRDSSLDYEDKVIFQKMLAEAVDHYGIILKELSAEINVNYSTVNRWSRGESTPHALVRKAIHLWVLDKIKSRIDNFNVSSKVSASLTRLATETTHKVTALTAAT